MEVLVDINIYNLELFVSSLLEGKIAVKMEILCLLRGGCHALEIFLRLIDFSDILKSHYPKKPESELASLSYLG